MNSASWPLRWVAPLLMASVPTGAAQPSEVPDPPSIELLEYLAEFEQDSDGRLLDPLDVQHDNRDQDTPPAPPSRSTSR